MSNKEILDLNSKIYGQYLPSAPAPHPYVENPMVDDLDASDFNIINVGSLIFQSTVPTIESVTLNCDENGALNIKPTQGIMRVYNPDNSGNGAYITTGIGNADSVAFGPIGVQGNIFFTPGTTSGAVNITSDLINSGTAVSGLVVQSRTSIGNAGILLQNANTTIQGFQLVVGGQTADGISEDHFQIIGYTGQANPKEIIDATGDGSSINFGDADTVGGCYVGVNGPAGIGRVYDTAYNLPPTTTITTVFTQPVTLSPGSALSPPSGFTVNPGTYQLQCVLNLENGDSTVSIPSGSIISNIQTASPSIIVPFYSEISITSPMIITPSAGTSSAPSFISGVFTITATNTFFVSTEISGTWNFGTNGYAQWQLVKLP